MQNIIDIREQNLSGKGYFNVQKKASPDIKQCFGEEAKQSVIESISLLAAALHHRVDDSAQQNTVDRIG